MFATWPDRLPLITRLTGSILVPDDGQQLAGNRATAYNDLAGQMRGTLDQFRLEKKIRFLDRCIDTDGADRGDRSAGLPAD